MYKFSTSKWGVVLYVGHNKCLKGSLFGHFFGLTPPPFPGYPRDRVIFGFLRNSKFSVNALIIVPNHKNRHLMHARQSNVLSDLFLYTFN